MTHKLEALRQFIKRLADHGVTAVCVGGAARDTYLGREPNDYDLVVLSQHRYDPLLEWIEAASEFGVRRLGNEGCPTDSNGDAEQRGLEHVYETGVKIGDTPFGPEAIKVQILVYTDEVTGCFRGNPEAAVEEHDCDLNKAWFEDIGGRLVPRVHYEFPSPFTGNVNTFRAGYANDARIGYIRSKFPEFNHTV